LYLNDPHSIALPADQIKQKIRARVTRGTIIYHLNKLKRYGFIPSHKKARKKILDAYFILKRKPKSIVGVENIKQIIFHATKMFFEYSYSKCSFALLKEKSKIEYSKIWYFFNPQDIPQLYLACLYNLLLEIKSILEIEESLKELTVRDFVRVYDHKISKIKYFDILFYFNECMQDPDSLKYIKEILTIQKLIINLFFGFGLDVDDEIVFDYFKTIQINLFIKLKMYQQDKATKEEIISILQTDDDN
jgi:hypothetical protein